MSQPNVLIIHTDQQSLWTVGAYGGPVATPHMDSLAAEGTRFTSFFTNHAVCTASRGCFLTGRYPHAHGASWNNIELNRDEVTLAHVLRDAGYETGYAGKWHLDGEPRPGWMTPERSMGFDDCRFMFNRGHWKEILERDGEHPPEARPYDIIGDENTFTTDWLATKTIEFIRQPRSTPFFYMVSIPDPHTPFTVRAPYDTMFSPKDMALPPTFDQPDEAKPDWARRRDGFEGLSTEARRDRLRGWKAQYFGQVACIDDNVGRILGALRDSRQQDNTIVVFTTDHGEFMGEHGLMHKGWPYDAAYRIPLLLRWPGTIPAGTTIDRVLGTVDFMPTLMGLMGLGGSGREQGRDASALVRQEPATWDDEAFMHLCGGGHTHLGVWTDRYELAYVRDKDAILFDRQSDPDQVTNLFDDPGHAAARQDLTDRIVAHCEDIEEPGIEWLKARLSAGRTTG